MQTTIVLPDSLYEIAQQLAPTLNLSENELYVLAITRFVRSNQLSPITRALNEIYSKESSTLDPEIAEMQFGSLEYGEW